MATMFSNSDKLTYIDMRNAVFNATEYDSMMPNGNASGSTNITIIVKDSTAKSFIEARLREVNRTGTVTIA